MLSQQRYRSFLSTLTFFIIWCSENIYIFMLVMPLCRKKQMVDKLCKQVCGEENIYNISVLNDNVHLCCLTDKQWNS